ncbi:MAG: GNAT family N-acetyltransferase/peptidase C39 family protein [Gammaproteobacteria bacterium]|nr:GNAT family N-acetyltransferase/peptidase C39 family protein [Gammaproteobacteria bacterium]
MVKVKSDSSDGSNTVAVTIRRGVLDDLDALEDLEQRCFDSDRISRRSFRRFLKDDSDLVVVAEEQGAVLGYALVLLHAVHALARLYSLAVDPAARGKGVARALMLAAEQAAAEQQRVAMRLEVRSDNSAAIALYQRLGYKVFGHHAHYYEDNADALRMHKRILFPGSRKQLHPLPYYRQTTPFTCGAACVLMATAQVADDERINRARELAIWREATTIFMTTGHGGCSPHGLALAAWRRGFDSQVWVSSKETPFIDTVRVAEKRTVMELVHDEFMLELAEAAIPVVEQAPTVERLKQALADGWVPIVLISTWRFDQRKVPHWVAVLGVANGMVYIHDPDVDESRGETLSDCQQLPIPAPMFDRVARYGRKRLRSAVLVRPRLLTT